MEDKMNKWNKEIIDDYANKLLIGLTDEENQMVLLEFEEIDRNIDLINKISNIENVEPMSHCLDDFVFELREDENPVNVPKEIIFKNCDSMKNDEVKVPKVVK